MYNKKKIITIMLFLFLSTNITFARHRKNRDRRTESNSSKFTFGFSQKSSEKSRHMQIFDQHAIFDFDTEISSAMTNTRDLQDAFRKDKKLLDVQIEYLERELVKLIQDHQINGNRSQEILETYTTLFNLCKQSYDLIESHTQKIQELFQETYKNYNTKIEQKIVVATQDPEILTEELIKRYENVNR